MGQASVAHEVKAAYLFKFGGYVEWPERLSPGAAQSFTIGVIDAEAVADALEKIAAKRAINGLPVKVRKLQRGDELAGVQMLFIGGAKRSEVQDVVARARELPILTVTDAENALAWGSMINFVAIDGKLRFEVAPNIANRHQLNISARLLAAAHKVAAGAS